MNMRFNSITCSNFMSFESASVDLLGNGFVKVVGQNNNKTDNSKSNGSGKSALWEALSWCLTGATVRGSKDIVRHGEEDCSVSVDFNVDNDNYVITRLKEGSKSNLLIYKNGEDKSGKGIRDTEVLLTQYLPDLTTSLLNSIVILGQGLPLRFSNNTPSGRKEILEKLSKSDFMIEDLKERVAARKSELEKSAKNCEDALLKINTESDMYKSMLAKKKARLDELTAVDLSQIVQQRDETLKSIEELERKISELSATYGCSVDDRMAQLQEQKSEESKTHLRNRDNIQAVYETNSSALSSQVSELKSDINHREMEIRKLQSITDICPTCGQKLPDVHKVDTTELEFELDSKKDEYNTLSDNLSKMKADRDSKISEEDSRYDSVIGEITRNYDEAKAVKSEIQTITAELNQDKSVVDDLAKTINTNQDSIKSCESEIKELEESLNSLETDYNEWDESLTEYKKRIDVQKEFDTALKRDFRGILLQNCISYIDSKAKEYAGKIFGTDLIKFELDGNNISISYAGKEYESMSGGEKKKVDVIIQFAIRSMLCKYLDFSCNLLILDEIFDELDNYGCQKVVDFIISELTDVGSVYVISHRNELDIPSDQVLTVVKDDSGVSRIM